MKDKKSVCRDFRRTGRDGKVHFTYIKDYLEKIDKTLASFPVNNGEKQGCFNLYRIKSQ